MEEKLEKIKRMEVYKEKMNTMEENCKKNRQCRKKWRKL